MDNNSVSLDKWRIYFKTANADIFGIIEHAVMVAAMDFPNELKLKRASIAEMLFTCRVTRCFGCNNVELALPNVYADEVQAKCQTNEFNEEFETGKSNDSKMNGGGNDRVEMELNANQISNCSFEDAEALSDEIDEECQTVAEVMRIKQIIDNHGEESESSVIDSLRRLQLMALSVETLKVTDIAKSVNALRKQESKQIKHLVRGLIDAWKVKVDEWVQTKEAVAGTESTPQSVKASAVEEEEEGLPSPPLDEGFFLTSNTMELSQFFDDMDDDGNLQNSGEFNKNHENGRKTSLGNQNIQKQQLLKGSMAAPQDRYTEQPKEQEALMKKPLIAAPQDWYTEQPKEQEAVMNKPLMAAPQDWCTKQPKEQEAVVKKAPNAAAQDWYTQQPKEQDAVLKKSPNAAAQDWYTQQPKEQEAVLKKSPNAAAQDWYTRQPKEQEAVFKKPINAAAQDWYTRQPKEQEAVKKKSTSIKPNKPSANGSGSGRLTKPTVEHKVNGNAEMKFQQKSDNATIDKRHAVSQQNKLKSPDENSFQAKLEVAKRKLQERRYQADEDAKKPRTNQFVETPNIPKQSLDHKNTQVKPGNYSKQWTNGSR